MASQPRKTSEFVLSSVKKPTTRLSRIAQPLKRSSIHDKANNGPPSSAARKSRTGSATPMRTPTRVSTARTPLRSSSNDRNTMVPMTAEKEKPPMEDKVWFHARHQRILDELVNVDGISNDFIQKGNLKSMTSKQFIIILGHLLKPVMRNIQLDGTNYVDIVFNVLQQLDYPYTINKSSLKTPNAPHCINNIIVLLGWLSDFKLNEAEMEACVEYKSSEELTSTEFATMFMEKGAEGFALWNNNQEEEFEEINEQLRQTYIHKNIGTGLDLDNGIQKLKYDISILEKEKAPLSLLMEHTDLNEESKRLKTRIDKSRNCCKDISGKIDAVRQELESKISIERNVMKELKDLKSKLTNQQITVDQKNTLLMELSQLKSILGNKKQIVIDFNDTTSDNEILLSRLIQKKFTSIDRLNNLVHKLSSDLNCAGMNSNGGKFRPEEYEIQATENGDASALDKQLDQLSDVLKGLASNFTKNNNALRVEITRLESTRNHLKSELEIKNAELENNRSKLEEITAEESVYEIELKDYVRNMEVEYRENEEKLMNIKLEIVKKTSTIAQLNDEAAKIKSKNEAFGLKSVNKCRELLEAKKQFHCEQTRVIRECERIFDEWEMEDKLIEMKKAAK
ncbi:unnamed protein product [Diamesa serratosioi]